MTAIVRNESRNLFRGTSLLAGLLLVITFYFLAVFPSIKEQAEAIADAFPPYLAGIMGLEALHTIEGFTAGWLLPFVWTLLVGVYVAYVTASMVSDDIRHRRMDLLLSNPVSRESVVLQKFAALWVPLVALNAVVFITLAVGTAIIGEPIDLFLLAVGLGLAIPYLLVCGAIGMVLSVTLDRVGPAQAGAIGAVFVLWLLEGVGDLDERYELLSALAPSHYYDPTAIMVHEEFGLIDAGILLAAAAVLLGISIVIFVRRDI